MIKISLLLAAAATVGCSTVSWEDNCGSVSLNGFLMNVSAGELEVTKDENCALTLTIKEGKSDQTKALESVAEGVVKGLKNSQGVP